MTASLLTRMVERLDAAPRAPLYSFLDRQGKEADSADYEEIVRRAAGAADLLRAAGVGPGDRVLLIFPPDGGLEFVTSFFGCVLLGAIAVQPSAAVAALPLVVLLFAWREARRAAHAGAAWLAAGDSSTSRPADATARQRLASDVCMVFPSGIVRW